MLVIRHAQMETFRQAAQDTFAAALIVHLKASLPGPAVSLDGHADWNAFARRAIAAGARYGIHSGSGLTTLAELMLQFGENFERSPLREWTAEILAQPRLPGQIKAAALRERYEALTGGRPVVVVG
jgi:hypothetical protein